MRSRPSISARIVAVSRMRLDRPTGAEGGAEAERRSQESLRIPVLSALRLLDVPMERRTAFIDTALVSGLDAGAKQVVVLGAGYDGRAFRFARRCVRYFEVDRSAVLREKSRRLEQLGLSTQVAADVPAELGRVDLVDVLADIGFNPSKPTVFLVEGLLGYLRSAAVDEVLRDCRAMASPGSALVAQFLIDSGSPGRALLSRSARDLALLFMGERRFAEFRPGEPQRRVAAAGWHIELSDVADTGGQSDVASGLLVVASPMAGHSLSSGVIGFSSDGSA